MYSTSTATTGQLLPADTCQPLQGRVCGASANNTEIQPEPFSIDADATVHECRAKILENVLTCKPSYPKSSGTLISFGTYAGSARGSKQAPNPAQAMHALVLDLDKAPPGSIEGVLDRLRKADLRTYWYTGYSHGHGVELVDGTTITAESARFVVWVSRPVQPTYDEYASAIYGLIQVVGDFDGLTPAAPKEAGDRPGNRGWDSRSAQTSQWWFAPRPEQPGYRDGIVEGSAADVDRLIAMQAPRPASWDVATEKTYRGRRTRSGAPVQLQPPKPEGWAKLAQVHAALTEAGCMAHPSARYNQDSIRAVCPACGPGHSRDSLDVDVTGRSLLLNCHREGCSAEAVRKALRKAGCPADALTPPAAYVDRGFDRLIANRPSVMAVKPEETSSVIVRHLSGDQCVIKADPGAGKTRTLASYALAEMHKGEVVVLLGADHKVAREIHGFVRRAALDGHPRLGPLREALAGASRDEKKRLQSTICQLETSVLAELEASIVYHRSPLTQIPDVSDAPPLPECMLIEKDPEGYAVARNDLKHNVRSASEICRQCPYGDKPGGVICEARRLHKRNESRLVRLEKSALSKRGALVIAPHASWAHIRRYMFDFPYRVLVDEMPETHTIVELTERQLIGLRDLADAPPEAKTNVKGGESTRRWIEYWARVALHQLDPIQHADPGEEPEEPPTHWEVRPANVDSGDDPLLAAAAALLLIYAERAEVRKTKRSLQAEVPTRLYRALLRPSDTVGWLVTPRCDLLTATPVPGALPHHVVHEIILEDSAPVQRVWVPQSRSGQTDLLAAWKAGKGKWAPWRRAAHFAREALAELQAQQPETPPGPALIVTYKAVVDAIAAIPEDERTNLLGDTSRIRWASYPLQGTNAYEDCSVSITVGDMWEQSVTQAQAILRTHGKSPEDSTLFWPIATAKASGHLFQAHERIRTRRRSTPAIQIHIGAVVPDRWDDRSTQVAGTDAGSVQAQLLRSLDAVGVPATDIGLALASAYGRGGVPVDRAVVRRSITGTKPTPVDWLFPLQAIARDRGVPFAYTPPAVDDAPLRPQSRS